MCAGPQLKFSFSISGRPVTYTRPLLNARFSRVFSAGCFHDHGWGQLYLSSESRSQKLPLFRPIPPTLSLPLLLSLPKSARASATGGLPGTSGPQLNQFVKERQDSSHTAWNAACADVTTKGAAPFRPCGHSRASGNPPGLTGSRRRGHNRARFGGSRTATVNYHVRFRAGGSRTAPTRDATLA